MTRNATYLLALALLFSCKEPPKNTPNPPQNSSQTPNITPPPITGDNKFPDGYCEYAKDDAKPEKMGGSRNYLFTSTHWGDTFHSVPFRLSCGSYVIISNGDKADLPMKPGKLTISENGGLGTLRAEMRIANAAGEVNIEVWDAKQLKGSFQMKGKGTIGSDAEKDISVRGSFDIQFSGETF